MGRRVQIEGMRELERALKRLGKVPQSSATKAARAGATIALKSARKNAPEGETGELAKGIILKKEKRTVRGKAVYDVMMDPAKNDIFVKRSKDGKKRYYYPASMEYGFVTRDGGYVPGYRFLRRSLEDNKTAIERKSVEVMAKEIDKALRKG